VILFKLRFVPGFEPLEFSKIMACVEADMWKVESPGRVKFPQNRRGAKCRPQPPTPNTTGQVGGKLEA